MRVVLDCNTRLLDDEQIALVFKGYLEAQGEHNAMLIRTGRFPVDLYHSGVRFRNEPWMGRFEEIASLPIVLARKWGDCDDVCAWIIGWYRARGIHATAKVYWRKYNTQQGERRLYHAEVRLPDGSVEDPSRYLGM